MALTLSLQFPTGRYVAASWGDRDEAEWPPHPARLCLGLLDALHRTGQVPEERAVLEWLCAQPAPNVIIPTAADAAKETLEGFFVPQNPSGAESVNHPRKPRSFPVVHLDPDQPTVFFHWPLADLSADQRRALLSLVTRLPRLGHSSSFCQIELDRTPAPDREWDYLQPIPNDSETPPTVSLRVSWPGLIASAEQAFDESGRSAEMAALMQAAAKGAKPDKMLRPAASPRGRHDPGHRWAAYAPPGEPHAVSGPWERRILTLKQTEGRRHGLTSTWQITGAFHKALLQRWGKRQAEDPALGPIPGWLSGHQPRPDGDSNPTQAIRSCHLAIFPLPFVDHPHADGHLLGLGLALPRPAGGAMDETAFRRQWRQAQEVLFGENGEIFLHAEDGSWDMTLRPESQVGSTRTTLQALIPSRWTGAAKIWRSVTPIILDRHPKPHFNKDPEAWVHSCQDIIRQSCERAGWPTPLRIKPTLHSPINGVPPAAAFVSPKSKPGMPPRFHLHAEIELDEPVAGPLLLGAGRYRGYGLMLPAAEKPSSASTLP